MSDYISRADAIEVVRSAIRKEWLLREAIVTDIEALPSAETHEIRTETHSVCLISKADAIEEISKGVWNVHELIGRINGLPSADAVQIPIKLEKRYPESKDEDITDAFMRGYLAGRSSAEAVQRW